MTMQDLIIEGAKSTPTICFRFQQRRLEIKGESYPENAAAFYAPVFSWLDAFLASLERAEVTVDLEITYFNSSSSKVLLDIFDLLEIAAGRNNPIIVNWRYHKDNDMALEYGEEFTEEVGAIQFNLVEFSQ